MWLYEWNNTHRTFHLIKYGSFPLYNECDGGRGKYTRFLEFIFAFIFLFALIKSEMKDDEQAVCSSLLCCRSGPLRLPLQSQKTQ